MSNTTKPSELKKRALLARQRLKMGYWQKLADERNFLEKNEGLGTEGIDEIQRERLRRDTLKATDVARAKREERLYEKVCSILDRDEDTLSPIGQLIDKDEYRRLDEAGKQKYILELSEKFCELSRRYYLEHKAGCLPVKTERK